MPATRSSQLESAYTVTTSSTTRPDDDIPRAALVELLGFIDDHALPPRDGDDNLRHMLRGVHSRSVETAKAILHLHAGGYLVQANVLGRTLFEDMLVSHWITLDPNATIARLERYEDALELRKADDYARHPELARYFPPPDVSDIEPRRAALEQEFRPGRHWSGHTMHQMVRLVEHMWNPGHPRLQLWLYFERVYTTHNLATHTTPLAIAIGLHADTVDRSRGFVSALASTHYTLANTYALIVERFGLGCLNDLQRLDQEHQAIFRPIGRQPRDV